MNDFNDKIDEVVSSKIFNEMEDERIFAIEAYKSVFYIKEACDEYFSVELTKETCQQLSKAFGELANLIGTTTEEDGE